VLIGGQEIAISPGKKEELMNVELPDYPMVSYDFMNYLTYEELPKTGVLLGVAYEPAPKGLTVLTVVAGSNAERAGLKQGDLLLALDGEPLTESFDLIYALKKKHFGERSALTVERAGTQLKLDVVFEKSGDEHQHGKP
jgi:S1-C subfamily serine protease